MPIPLSLYEVHHRGVDELFPWMYGGGDAASRLWDRYLKEKNVGSIVDTCIGDSQTELFNIDISRINIPRSRYSHSHRAWQNFPGP